MVFSIGKNNDRKLETQILLQVIKNINSQFIKNNYPISHQSYYFPNNNNEQLHGSYTFKLTNPLVIGIIWFVGNLERYFNRIEISFLKINEQFDSQNELLFNNPKLLTYLPNKSLQNPIAVECGEYCYFFMTQLESQFPQYKSQIVYFSIKKDSLLNLDKLEFKEKLIPKLLSKHLGLWTRHQPILINGGKSFIIPAYYCSTEKDCSLLIECFPDTFGNIVSKFVGVPNSINLVQPIFCGDFIFYRNRNKKEKTVKFHKYDYSNNKLTFWEIKNLSKSFFNCNSGFSVLKLENEILDGYLYLGNLNFKYNNRSNLFIYYSKNNEFDFKKVLQIEPNFSSQIFTQIQNKLSNSNITFNMSNLEFSYPTMIEVNNSLIINYTFNRDTIKVISLKIKNIKKLINKL